MEVLRHTNSLCPVCLKRITAVLEKDGEDVYLRKLCPDHGDFSCVLWRGKPDFEEWTSRRFPLSGPQDKPENACPESCGLCGEHKQKSCTVILEVTENCQLKCPVCFADAGSPREAGFDFLAGMLGDIRRKAPEAILQISGGEPTLRDDICDLVGLASELEYPGLQLNTNGLRLAEEPGFASCLKKAGLGWVFLQFDGLRESTHIALRGRSLRSAKEQAIRACEESGLGVVLVPTLVPGINDDEMGDIIRFALEKFPVVRGVHFQPISYFGRFPGPQADENRITLPEVMNGLVEQTGGMMKLSHFHPSRCEHERCSFRGVYLVEKPERITPVGSGACCFGSSTAEEGAKSAIESIRRRWGADVASVYPAKYSTNSAESEIEDAFERFIRIYERGSFSISAMAFQDAENLDLERLRFCCVHVASHDGRLVPFCAWNLTGRDGRTLHRCR